MPDVRLPRAITPEELAVVEWLLNSSTLPAAAPFRNSRIAGLQVTAYCDCGCASLYFGGHTGPFEMLADEIACYPDGEMAGVLLWGSRGEVAWLEVYEMSENAHRRPLRAENLRRWADAG